VCHSRVLFYLDVMKLGILCCAVLFIVAGAKFRSRAAAAKIGKTASEREQRKSLASRRQRSRSVESLLIGPQHSSIADGINAGNYDSVAVVIDFIRR